MVGAWKENVLRRSLLAGSYVAAPHVLVCMRPIHSPHLGLVVSGQWPAMRQSAARQACGGVQRRPTSPRLLPVVLGLWRSFGPCLALDDVRICHVFSQQATQV